MDSWIDIRSDSKERNKNEKLKTLLARRLPTFHHKIQCESTDKEEAGSVKEEAEVEEIEDKRFVSEEKDKS